MRGRGAGLSARNTELPALIKWKNKGDGGGRGELFRVAPPFEIPMIMDSVGSLKEPECSLGPTNKQTPLCCKCQVLVSVLSEESGDRHFAVHLPRSALDPLTIPPASKASLPATLLRTPHTSIGPTPPLTLLRWYIPGPGVRI